jgi:hypothetical protein
VGSSPVAQACQPIKRPATLEASDRSY